MTGSAKESWTTTTAWQMQEWDKLQRLHLKKCADAGRRCNLNKNLFFWCHAVGLLGGNSYTYEGVYSYTLIGWLQSRVATVLISNRTACISHFASSRKQPSGRPNTKWRPQLSKWKTAYSTSMTELPSESFQKFIRTMKPKRTIIVRGSLESYQALDSRAKAVNDVMTWWRLFISQILISIHLRSFSNN